MHSIFAPGCRSIHSATSHTYPLLRQDNDNLDKCYLLNNKSTPQFRVTVHRCWQFNPAQTLVYQSNSSIALILTECIAETVTDLVGIDSTEQSLR